MGEGPLGAFGATHEFGKGGNIFPAAGSHLTIEVAPVLCCETFLPPFGAGAFAVAIGRSADGGSRGNRGTFGAFQQQAHAICRSWDIILVEKQTFMFASRVIFIPGVNHFRHKRRRQHKYYFLSHRFSLFYFLSGPFHGKYQWPTLGRYEFITRVSIFLPY